MSAGKSWLVSAREAIKLFAHKQRLRLSSAQADVEIQALKKSLNLLSKLDISMTADRIALSAKEEVVINGGGSYTIWNASGITSGTTGTHTVQAASFSYPPGKRMPVVMPGQPQVPSARLPRGQMLIERRYSDNECASEAPYRARLADGTGREGRLDNAGRALLLDVPQGEQGGEGPMSTKETCVSSQEHPKEITKAAQQKDRA